MAFWIDSLSEIKSVAIDIFSGKIIKKSRKF
jgi:hypothetical protein